MCTVSWLRQSDGYVLFCNRDERNSRKTASGPRVGSVRGVSYVAPVDGDHGGSWIGANQFGLTLCLLNRYGDWQADPDTEYTSRGLLLMELLDCWSSQYLCERLNDVDLNRFKPLTMLALSVEAPAILVDWTGLECTIDLDAEERLPLSSSSLRDTNVIAQRQQLFADISRPTGINLELLHKFHRSHLPERGSASVCMHRDDAATVSLSVVTISPGTVEFLYHPTSPCLEARVENVLIDRGAVHAQAVAS